MKHTTDSADRPASEKREIEITPEMIEAGRAEISRVWIDFTGPEGESLWDSTLSRVYLAMREARPR